MRLPVWLGVGERRWMKSPDEEIQPSKTVWDILQLLIIPLMLAAVALFFNASQASRDRGREDRRIREDRALAEAAREDATLEAYLGKMGGLMVDRDLLRSRPGSAVRQIARTSTIATLRRLNGARKGEVVHFLYESGLLRVRLERDGLLLVSTPVTKPVINLEGADLRGVDLVKASLSPSDGYGVLLEGDLRGARFEHAVLNQTYFESADLRGASFNDASVQSSSLYATDLRGASFAGAQVYSSFLDSADLRGASFKEADVRETILGGTKLQAASFKGASFVKTGLDDANLEGAVFDQAVIGTTFKRTVLDNASFVGATFNATDFVHAQAQDVDFSHAVNLSSLRVCYAVFSNVRLDGADGRPKGWGPKGTLHPDPRETRECES
jgi:uncharacterized protein YjbI with pentapeptide repeats